MRRHAHSLRLFVAVFVCALLLLISRPWLPSEGEAHATAPAPRGTIQQLPAAAGDEPALESSATAPVDDEPTRTPVSPGAPSETVTLEVRVLLGSGEPARGASVWFFDGDDPVLGERLQTRMRELLSENRNFSPDILFHESLLALGQIGVADEEGVVRRRLGGGDVFILAESGSERGSASRKAGDPLQMTIHLPPCRELLVRVLDPSGRPRAGVPVTFGRWHYLSAHFLGGSMQSLMGGSLEGHSRAPDGIARIDGIRVEPIDEGSGEGMASKNRWIVTAQVLLPEFSQQSVDISAWPQEPVELVVPDWGAVRVLVEGIPAGLQAECLLSTLVTPGGRRGNRSAPASVERSEALFPRVGLGLVVEAELTLNDHRMGKVTGPGPITPGSEVTLRVELEHLQALRGRLLGQDGRPVGEGEWSFKFWHSSRSRARSPFDLRWSTDEEGRFHVILPESLSALEPGSVTISAWSSSWQTILDGPVARAVLPRSLGAGTHDLGDLSLAPPETLVSGRVVDTRGNPVEGARLELSEMTRRTRAGKERWRPIVIGDAYDEPDEAPGGQNLSGKDGTFSLPAPESILARGGTARGTQLSLHASLEGYLMSEPLRCRAGSEDQVITLERAGALALELQLPVRMESSTALTLELVQRLAGGETKSIRLGSEPGRGEEVIWSTIPSGSYTFKVHHSCFLDPLVEIPGLWVEPDGVTRDPRLLPLDLRSELRLVKLTLLDEVGQPLRGPASAGQVGQELVHDEGGEEGLDLAVRELLVPVRSSLPRDVKVEALGYRSVTLKALASDRSVSMSPGFPVTFRLESCAPRPDDDGVIRAYLLSAGGGEFGWSKGADVLFGPELVAEIEGDPCSSVYLSALVPEAGTYRVIWVESGEGSTRTGSTVQITEEDLGGVIALRPPN